MARVYTNTACRLYNTDYCRMLHMVNCDSCTVASRNKASMDDLIRDLDALRALLPEDGIEELFLTNRCVLCKKQEPNPRTCYALLDLGNHEPKREGTNFLGIKTKLRTGSLLPVQLAACDDCKKRFAKLDYVVPFWVTGAGVVSIALLSYRTIREFFMAYGAWVPFVVFAAVMLAALCVGMLLRKSRLKRFASLMHLDVMEIEKLKKLKELGWFELNEKKQYTKLIFNKKRLRQGVFTGSLKNSASDRQNV